MKILRFAVVALIVVPMIAWGAARELWKEIRR